nr:hypothetical protein GCM10020093_073700 [Planobispora longispora]
MLEETLQICRGMWEGEQGSEQPFSGRHYALERLLNLPQSHSRPRPPIMIGGGGDRTLRLVARYADACNLYAGSDVRDRLDVLRGHCAAEGRDYDEIEKTCILPFDVADAGQNAGALVEELRKLEAAGIQTAVGIVSGPDPARQVELIGKHVVPAVA